MKVYTLTLLALFSFYFTNAQLAANKQQTKETWKTETFNHQVFIENNGQFNSDITTNDKILFEAILGNVKAYFTSSGVVYRYDDYTKNKDNVRRNLNTNPIIRYAFCKWKNSNPDVAISATDEQQDYYTYSNGNANGIKAGLFKKIIYRNIYPGIDAEYSFIKGRQGIKYNLIIHPGANPALIKLAYEGSSSGIHINSLGDAIIQTDAGEITDHAPVCFFQNGREHISANYVIENGNEETFSINVPKGFKDNIVIDPWTTNPFFSKDNAACDVECDNNGNVYVYGSYNSFQLCKLNSSGMVQWTFNASSISGTYYGDFTVDKKTGTSYIVEGANSNGAKVLKINTNGTLMATFSGSANMQEMWRIAYNPCSANLIIGGGEAGTPNAQCATLDTTLTGLTPENPLGAIDGYHNVCLMAIDPNGANAYMAIAKTTNNSNFGNVIMSVSLPALSPANYAVSDSFGFNYASSINYGAPRYGGLANAMNGMVASANWLYIYNGDTLKKVNKSTGAIVAVKQIYSGSPYMWGGLDVDACNNVYVGEKSAIAIYDSSFNLKSTIPLADTVYDVILGINASSIYSCGNGFVTQIAISSPSVAATTTITNATCGACNGHATANLSLCGTSPTGISYLWSPGGQTTQTATALCAGTYTVTMNTSCGTSYRAATVIGTVGASTITATAKSATICAGNSDILTVNGAGTYLWSTGATTSSITVSPASTATYTVVGNNGSCSDSATLTITVLPTPIINITTSSDTICQGYSTTISASGASSYTWAPASSLNSTTGTVVTAEPSVTTTYTIVGSSTCGSDTVTMPIVVLPNNGFDLTGNLQVCIDTPSFNNASIQACIFNNRYSQCVLTNGTLKLVLDTAFHISSTIADSVVHKNGDTLIWHYNNISGIGGANCVSLTGTVSGIPKGDSVFVSMFITPTVGDSNPANNSVTYWVKPFPYNCVGIPFDPNEKSVSPIGDIADTQKLTYTIHFQNTGTAIAHNVIVIDTLSANLDPTTLKVLSNSSEMTTQVVSGNIIKFIFNNINLPDTAISKTNSIGVFSFAIKPSGNVKPGDKIYNNAGIYFDANPAIITNKTVNTITIIASVQNITSTWLNIACFPNPFTTSISVVFNTDGQHYLDLYDAVGRKIESIQCIGKQYELQRGKLAAGVYFIKVHNTNGGYVATSKIVVE